MLHTTHFRSLVVQGNMRSFQLSYRCPDLANQEDAEIVRETLMSSPGVGDIDVDWRTKMVAVVSANQDGGVAVFNALRGCGFPAESAI